MSDTPIVVAKQPDPQPSSVWRLALSPALVDAFLGLIASRVQLDGFNLASAAALIVTAQLRPDKDGKLAGLATIRAVHAPVVVAPPAP